jgi:hypothetical protein
MNRTRQKHLLVALILTTLVLLACNITVPQDLGQTVRGTGNVIEESRKVSGVTAVELATLGNLFIKVSDTELLRIEAEDNLMEHLESEVRGGKLRIGTQGDVRLNATRPVNYYLTVTGLDTIVISSSGDIQAPDLEVDQISVTISSSGDLEMGVLNADTLKVVISSSGDLDIGRGEVKTQNVNISSSGNYRAKDLASDKADVLLNSSGSATIWVKDSLKAILNSSGDVRYRGNPTLDVTSNSSGKAVQIGE